MLVSIALMGVVYVGRRLGFVLIALSALAHVAVGLLVSNGIIRLDGREVDPMMMQNWIRMAAITSLLAILLANMIDSVIRHVEASSSAATEALDKLRKAYERLGRLHDRLEAAKEDERRFLAHELHDELGQTLTALKLRLQLGARSAAARDGVGDGVALVDNLIARVRKMSVDLRPPLLDEVGLVPALRAYLESQSAVSGVAMELEEGTEKTPLHLDGRLPPDLEIACFRVVQESITNALRHASARHVASSSCGVRPPSPCPSRTTAAASTSPARWMSPPPRGTWAWSACASGCARAAARSRSFRTPAWGRR